MESCEMSLIKYILFIFNLVLAVSEIGIIIAGALVLADVGDIRHFVKDELLTPPIILIVLAAIVFVVAFLGCFGVIRESQNLLIAFSVCLLVILTTELAVGIVAAVYKNEFGEALQKALRKSIENYSQNESDGTAWDTAQAQLQCCGVDGPNDWQGQQIPSSCCHSYDEFRSPHSRYCLNIAKGKYLYQNGCYDQFTSKINDNAKILVGVGIGIALVEIIGIVLACWLTHSIKKESGGK